MLTVQPSLPGQTTLEHTAHPSHNSCWFSPERREKVKTWNYQHLRYDFFFSNELYNLVKTNYTHLSLKKLMLSYMYIESFPSQRDQCILKCQDQPDPLTVNDMNLWISNSFIILTGLSHFHAWLWMYIQLLFYFFTYQ